MVYVYLRLLRKHKLNSWSPTCDSVTRLTKFSFRHLAFEGVTRTGFRQVSDWDGYFGNFWLSLRWSIQRRAAAEAKFTRLWTNCPNLAQNCHNEVCHIFWPFVRTLRDTVTLPIFRHVRYPLWRVTDESIEIVQYVQLLRTLKRHAWDI